MAQAKAAPSSSAASNSEKLIVVTGASSGIGAACVIPFAKAGHPVLMLARNVGNMEKNKGAVVKEVGDSCKNNIFIYKCDVTATELSKDGKTHSIGSAIKDVLSKNDKLFVDCLINNAGIMLLNSVVGQSDKDMKLMIDVNINGVLNGLRAVTGDMVKRKAGTIINISSMAGKRAIIGGGNYCGTKFAVGAITEALRQEVAPSSVRVCVVCPGVVATNLLSTNSQAVQDQVKGMVKAMEPHGPLMPQDIADGCYFLYSQPPRCCIREIQICPTNAAR